MLYSFILVSKFNAYTNRLFIIDTLHTKVRNSYRYSKIKLFTKYTIKNWIYFVNKERIKSRVCRRIIIQNKLK